MPAVVVGFKVLFPVETLESFGRWLTEEKDETAVAATPGGKLEIRVMIVKGFVVDLSASAEETALQGARG